MCVEECKKAVEGRIKAREKWLKKRINQYTQYSEKKSKFVEAKSENILKEEKKKWKIQEKIQNN